MPEPEQPTSRSILLWPGAPPNSAPGNDFRPWLDPFPIQTDTPKGAVLICPGGGYRNRAPHEGTPIARAFNAAGFHAFVVQYRVAPNHHPAPLMDASRALRVIRERADEWKVDRDRIAVCGFSAGGHLAASLGVYCDDGDAKAADVIERHSCRPNALILCYAVFSTGEFGHRGCWTNLLGENPSEEALRRMSLELRVTEETPPAFLWHTVADPIVPVENALLMAEALRRHKVPFELHVYPEGRHGLGLAPNNPHVATWMGLCCQWLRGMGW